MDLIVGKKELEAALKALKPAVSTRAMLPALGGVRLHAWIDGGPNNTGTLHLSGTDLELAIIRRAPATVNGPGKCLLPFKALLQAVSAMQGETIQIVLEKEQEGQATKPVTYTAGQAKIISDARTVTLRTLPLEDFPNLASPDDAPRFSVDAQAFAQAFGAVTIAASTDEARPVLTSVRMERAHGQAVSFVATDSYRLAYRHAYVEAGVPEGIGAVNIPARLGQILQAQQGKRKQPALATVRVGPSQVSIQIEGMTYLSRLVEGDYPNWKQLIPTETTVRAEFSSSELASAIKGAGAFGELVRLEMGGVVELKAGQQDLGEFSETLERASSNFGETAAQCVAAFNPDYLADALKFVGEETVHLSGRDGLKPWLWANGNVEESAYLLMPVRI